MLPYIHLFGFQLPTYGLMALLGITVCAVFLFIRHKKYDIMQDDLLHSILFAAIGAMIGGKILYWITIIPYIADNAHILFSSAEHILAFLTQGFVFYGGLIGALLMVWLYCRIYRLSFYNMMHLAAPTFPLFHLFGRVGCFLVGCCHGIEVSWGIAFQHSIGAPNNVALLPVQLIEAGFNLCLFAMLFWMQVQKKQWNLLCIYLATYAAGRFILEFFRGDFGRGIILGLSTSQWISIVVVVAVVLNTWVMHKRRKQPL